MSDHDAAARQVDPAGHRCSTTDPESTQPGCGDVVLKRRNEFGSLIAMMISRQFQHVDGRANCGRFYTECRFCFGNDMARPAAVRTSGQLVEHYDDCLLARHLPQLRGLATATAPGNTSERSNTEMSLRQNNISPSPGNPGSGE